MPSVLVVGSSLPALAAALECAEVGIEVRILPGADPLPARGVRDPDAAVAEFLEHVARSVAHGRPDDERVLPQRLDADRAAVRGADGSWRPQPEPQVLGIPAVPISRDALAVLGAGAGFRGYLDRVKPVLTIGKEHRLDHLVTTRVGRTILDRLVVPAVRERFGVDPGDLEVAVAAPGLNEAITRTGSLTGAVLATADRHAAEEAAWSPLAGWEVLQGALLDRLSLYAAVVVDPGSLPDRAVEAAAESSAPEHAAAAPPAETELSSGAGFDAVIADVGHPLAARFAGAALADLTARLAPIRGWRIRAEVPVSAVPAGAAGGTLEVVIADDGEPWTVRTRPDRGAGAGPGWIAELAGPRGAERPEPPAAERIRALLTQTGLTAGGDPVVRVEAAPWLSVAAEEAAAAARDEVAEAHPEVLLTGADAYGGEPAAALADARVRALHLRRRLTGISE